MNTLRATQICFPLKNSSSPCPGNFTSRQRSTICFCNSDGSGTNSSSPSEGDKRKQELLARILMLQAQKVRLTDFLDERSAYLTQYAEDANAEFDEIGENAMKELDAASTRIMDKLESQMQAFEETAEMNREEIEKNEKVIEEFEDQIQKDRNEGLFFKNLGDKAPKEKTDAEGEAQKAEPRLEAEKIRKTIRDSAGSKVRGNIYLGLMSLLSLSIANAIFAVDTVEWQKVAVLGLIFTGLLAQFFYEKSLSSTTEERQEEKSD